MTATLALSTHRRLSLHFALTVSTHRGHWGTSLVITIVLSIAAHHRRLSHVILPIVLSMSAVLSVTATHRRLSLHSALTVSAHWRLSHVILTIILSMATVLSVTAHHWGLSHTILTIILSMTATLALSTHRRLSLHSALTVSTHRGLSHAHSHTAVSDGIGSITNRYGFFIAAGAHFKGLTVFKFRTTVKHGIVALCEIACREEFFSGLITDFYRVSGTAVSA